MQKKNDISKIISNKNNFDFILSIDRGNTRDKFSLYDLKEKRYLLEKTNEESDLLKFNLASERTLVALSDVSLREFNFPFEFVLSPKALRAQNHLFTMPIFYSESLGEDRLISGHYLFHLENTPLCLIDSGTFTTIDFIDSKGFQGGYILPGKSLLNDCYTLGARLEAPKPELEIKSLPHSTDDAISQGAYLSFTAPLFNILEKFPVQMIYLTGEHATHLKKALQNEPIFSQVAIHLSSNLILKSLTHFAEGVLEDASFTHR